MNFRLFFYSTLIIFGSVSLFGQDYLMVDPDHSKVWVDGSSTLKNWSAQVKDYEGKVMLDSQGQVSQVQLSFETGTMDGGRGADMNKKIYKALKTSEHPQILFVGGPAKQMGDQMTTTGTLTIAGKEIQTTVAATGSITTGLKGEHALKLSDFDIEPPTAMFGQIVTYDDITIGFELSFKK